MKNGRRKERNRRPSLRKTRLAISHCHVFKAFAALKQLSHTCAWQNFQTSVWTFIFHMCTKNRNHSLIIHNYKVNVLFFIIDFKLCYNNVYPIRVMSTSRRETMHLPLSVTRREQIWTPPTPFCRPTGPWPFSSRTSRQTPHHKQLHYFHLSGLDYRIHLVYNIELYEGCLGSIRTFAVFLF